MKHTDNEYFLRHFMVIDVNLFLNLYSELIRMNVYQYQYLDFLWPFINQPYGPKVFVRLS